MLRMLLLRFEPDDRLFDMLVRVGRLARLSERSSSLDSRTSHTEEVVLSWLNRAGSGAAGSEATSCAEGAPGNSSSDQTEDTLDRWGFQRPEAGPGVKSRSLDMDVSARELDDGARMRGN